MDKGDIAMDKVLENYLIENIIIPRNLNFDKIVVADASKNQRGRIDYTLWTKNLQKSVSLIDNPDVIIDNHLYCDYAEINGAILWQLQFNSFLTNKEELLKIVCYLFDTTKIDIQFLREKMKPLFNFCNFDIKR